MAKHSSKENRLYALLALIALVVLILVNAEKIWDKVDKNVVPLVSTEEDAYVSTAGAGSADAQWINIIHVNWSSGNVYVSYAKQQRITWKETFTQGGPSQYNTMQYWMNTHTLFIEYRTQEWLDKDKQTNLKIAKDLYITLPQGVVLEELVVHNPSGSIICDVEVKKKELR